MKYLKKINLNESKSDEILDVLDVFIDLKDDDFVKKISAFNLTRNGRLSSIVYFNKNYFNNIRNIEDMNSHIQNLNTINSILERINYITDLEFSFEGDKLSIYFETVDGIKNILSKQREGAYRSKNLPVQINLNSLPNDIQIAPQETLNGIRSFIINNDLSCRLIVSPTSWGDVKEVNNDVNLQNLIVEEFKKYGFEFVKKWNDENLEYVHYGKVMWFEFYMKSII